MPRLDAFVRPIVRRANRLNGGGGPGKLAAHGFGCGGILQGTVQRDLIADIGMSEGNDTAVYLNKGFRVVGVEADPRACKALEARFAAEIAEGRLILLNRAACGSAEGVVRFFADAAVQGHSRMVGPDEVVEKWSPNGPVPGDGEVVEVPAIDWPGIAAVAGVPYYAKIDIEGAEAAFLASMAGPGRLPTYASAECHEFEPIERLHEAGYRQFRLINQLMLDRFPPPDPPREGRYFHETWLWHISGTFGLELPGREWVDYEGVRRLWDAVLTLREHETAMHGWFDCHATGAAV